MTDMKLILKRIARKAGYTVGRLYVERESPYVERREDYLCDTLEPPIVGNESHPKGAIAEGEYEVRLTWSRRFGRVLPLVGEVPGFEGIRLHAGNTVADTRGCILVGRNTEVGRLSWSRATLIRVMEIMSEAKGRGTLVVE